MLLGSFQEISNDGKGKIVKLGDVSSHFNDALGFRPLWCFPMENFQSAAFHALTVAPNIPELFYVFNTNEYYRIDRIKHYQQIFNNAVSDENVADCINNSIDDFHSEIIIDREIAEKATVFMMPTSQLSDVGRKIHFNQLKTYPPLIFKDVPDWVDETVLEMFRRIPQMQSEIPDNIKDGLGNLSSKGVQIHIELIHHMIRFSMTMFPLIYHLLHDNRGISFWLRCMEPKSTQIMKLCFQDFPTWANEDCSLEKYDEMIETFKTYLITNEDLLRAYCKHELPQRNDKCPCGSGKKFKKCCSKYF